ncbi:MAG TPA: cell division FtsA domain-containing protein [Bacillota bacterium]|nr:cell division FtsA domain-containing protein [Bacillota bacterium]
MKSINTTIELGTTKLTVLISRTKKDGNIEILGLGNVDYPDTHSEKQEHPEFIEGSLKRAIGQAEEGAGYKVRRSSLGIPNEFCGLIRNYKEIYPRRDLTIRDIRRLRKLTEDYTVPEPWGITDVYYGSFNVDGLSIAQPRGIYSEVFGLESSLICMDSTFVTSMVGQVQALNIGVNQVIPAPAALGTTMVLQEEMDAGALVIDIGGNSTDIAYFEDGRPLVLDWLPVGGRHISNDVQEGMSITLDEADRLKRQCVLGQVPQAEQEQDEDMRDGYKHTSDRVDNLDFLEKIIEARVEEMLQMAKGKAASSGLLRDSCRTIITGGGVAMLKGIKGFATDVLGMPVRIGVPDTIGLASPVYASVYSLAMADKSLNKKGLGLVKYVQNLFFNLEQIVLRNQQKRG